MDGRARTRDKDASCRVGCRRAVPEGDDPSGQALAIAHQGRIMAEHEGDGEALAAEATPQPRRLGFDRAEPVDEGQVLRTSTLFGCASTVKVPRGDASFSALSIGVTRSVSPIRATMTTRKSASGAGACTRRSVSGALLTGFRGRL